MRRIDELHLERPFAGSRMLRDFLAREGVETDRPPRSKPPAIGAEVWRDDRALGSEVARTRGMTQVSRLRPYAANRVEKP